MTFLINKSATALTSIRWVSLVLGIVLILTGFWIFQAPLSNYSSLSIFFSVAIFITGLLEILFALLTRKKIEDWVWYLIGGILDIIIGVLLLVYPFLTILVLLHFVAIWFMFRGVMRIGVAILVHTYKFPIWSWPIIFGMITILFSFLVNIKPDIGKLTAIILIAISFISFGVFQIAISISLNCFRKINSKLSI